MKPVRSMYTVYLIEEIIDGIHLRRHNGLPQLQPQVFSEKHQGTAVGKDKTVLFQLGAVSIVTGHLLKERIHSLSYIE